MFKYLFYRIFRFQHKIIGEDRTMAALSTIFSISFFIAMNIASIWIYFDKHTGLSYQLKQIVDNPNSLGGTKIAIPIALGTIVLIPVYFIFYHKKKYEKIIKEMEDNDKRKNEVNNIIAIFYEVVTIIVFLILFFS